jgi:hypothetical protein
MVGIGVGIMMFLLGGGILLDFSAIGEWEGEPEVMNGGKVGEPYHYPESFTRLLYFIRLLFHLPYRQCEDFVRALARYVEGLQAPDYTTICRRVNRLNLSLDESLLKSPAPITIAVNASSVKVHNSGDWIRRVWRVKKGYLKIHFAVNIKTKQVVSMDVSSGKVLDGRLLKRPVKKASKNFRVERVLADGEYDSKENFTFLSPQQHQASNQGESNSAAKSRKCLPRKYALIEQKTFKPKAWSGIHRFGYRWRVEGAFSTIKRIFGEYVTAKKFANMAKEMAMKAHLCNIFITTV